MMANRSIADFSSVVRTMTNCSATCRSLTTSSVFEIARDHALPDVSTLVRLVNDCAACCDIAVLLIERKSHIVVDFLQLCEELTMACAWECGKYGFDICKQCAESCELVAKACLPYIVQKEPV